MGLEGFSYTSPTGYHRHHCRGCQHVWEHPDDVAERPWGDRVDAHTCPQCGRIEDEKYCGERPPSVVAGQLAREWTAGYKAGRWSVETARTAGWWRGCITGYALGAAVLIAARLLTAAWGG